MALDSLVPTCSKLGEQIAIAERAGVDFIHFDVMDGRFVPNITFGMPVARAVREATRLPLDVHLMIVEPEKYVRDFVEAGADTVTIQVERRSMPIGRWPISTRWARLRELP